MMATTWKTPYILLGIALGCAMLRFNDASATSGLVLLGLPLILFALVVIKDKEKWLLTIALIDITLGIDKNFFLRDDIIASRYGFLISLTTMTLVCLYIMWIIRIYNNDINRQNTSPFARLHILSIGFLLSYILSIYNSTDIMTSLFEIFFQFQALLLYFYIIHYITDEQKLTYVVRVLLVCLFAQSALIFIQFLTQSQFNLTGQVETISTHIYDGHLHVMRPGGTADSPAAASAYLTALLFLALGFFFSRQERVERLLVGATLMLGGGALILTHTRAAWASFAVSFGLFLGLGWRRKWVSVKSIVAVAVLSVLIMLPFSVRLYYRLTASDKGAGYARVHLAQLAWNMIQDHWITGVGINNFGLVIQEYLSPDLRGKWLYLVHNKYLLVFAETGIVGLLFFLLILLEMAYLCVRCMKSNNGLIALVGLGILSGLMCHAAHMMVDIFTSRSAVELFWTIAALTVVTEKLFSRQIRQNASPLAPLAGVARSDRSVG